jgi:hypothetical protein
MKKDKKQTDDELTHEPYQADYPDDAVDECAFYYGVILCPNCLLDSSSSPSYCL